MTKIFLTILSLLALPMMAIAANNDASLSANTIISVGGINLTVSGNGGSMESISVDGSTITVIMPAGSYLQLTSSDRRTLTVSNADAVEVSSSCSSSESIYTFRAPSGITTDTFTISPTSSTCATGGGGGGGGGGSSSGGGGSSGAPTIPSQTAALTVSALTTVPAVYIVQPSGVAISVSPVFSKTLKKGMSHSDVKRLQQLLNSDSDTKISSSGVGSPGKEGEFFGSLTEKALQKFQAKYNLVSSGAPETTGYGLVGPKTMAKLEEVFSKAQPTAPAVAQPSVVAISVSPVFSQGLSKGTSNSDVKRLQQLLNSDPDTKISSSGVGSPGKEGEFFGSLTEKAVQKFQEKYGIAKPGDAGYGSVGPKTRVKIQEIYNQGTIPSTPVAPSTPIAPVSTGTSVQEAALKAQLNDLQKQLNEMLKQLNASQ